MKSDFRAQMVRAGNSADIWIYSEIGDFGWGDGLTAEAFVSDLRALGDVEAISVHINSPGGYVFDGIAIYNALRTHPAEVTVYVDGLAASIASVIAMSASSGRLIVRKGAMMMVHRPWSIAIGDSDDMRKEAETLDQIEESILSAYRSRVRLSDDELRAAVASETWLTADEAIEYGFADVSDEPLDTAASYSLRCFHQPPVADFRVPALPLAAMSALPIQEEDSHMAGTEVVNIDDALADFRARENERRSEIRTVFGARFAPEFPEILDACLDDMDCTPDAARAKLLDAISNRPTTSAVPLGGDPVMVADAADKRRAGISNAILARLGVVERDRGNQYSGYSFADIASDCLERNGHNTRSMRPEEVARKVLNVHTTSDFPELLADVANKQLRRAYDLAQPPYQRWCAIGEVSDFKASKRPQLGAFSDMSEIVEGGEYTYGTFSEESESVTAKTYGRGLLVTRQMIVNDDLGAFGRVATYMGNAAARQVNTAVITSLMSGSSAVGPTMGDGVALFDLAGHGNLQTSGGAPSVTTWGAAVSAMLKQKSGTQTLNIRPRYILVPPELESAALQLVQSEHDPAKTSRAANIYRNSFEVITDADLSNAAITGYNAGHWYAVADPMLVPAYEVAFLDGQSAPFTDDEVDFDSDALKFKVRLDFGVAPIDYRGIYRNDGA